MPGGACDARPGAVRDTILVTPGRRVVVAFDALNPGWWALHAICSTTWRRACSRRSSTSDVVGRECWRPSSGPSDHLLPEGERTARRPARVLVWSRAPRRGEPVRPAPLEPIENAIAQATQRRDVVGQKHEAERQHPEAENRQDGEAPAEDQEDAQRGCAPSARRAF